MKTLIVIAAMFAATVASAKDIQAMSWGEILSDSNLTTYNDLQFQNGPGLGVTFKRSTDASVCHDGAFIYGGISRVEVCSGSDDNSNCKMVSVKLKTPFRRSYQAEVCTGGDDSDCKVVTKALVQTPNRKVAVYSKGHGSDNDDMFLAKKAYTIPYCADLTPVPAN